MTMTIAAAVLAAALNHSVVKTPNVTLGELLQMPTSDQHQQYLAEGKYTAQELESMGYNK